MVDESIEFVLSRLNYSVGTRKETTAVSGQYELPREVVAEAIINALLIETIPVMQELRSFYTKQTGNQQSG